MGDLVDKWASIVDPATRCRCVGRGRIADKLNARLANIFETNDYFRLLAFEVIADTVRYEFLFEAAKMEVTAITQELRAMFLIPDVDRVSSKHMKNLSKHIS